MIFPSLIIYDQKTLLSKTWLLEMQILFIVFSDWRNNRIYCISFLQGTGSCFCPVRILKWNSYLDEVNLEAAKI